MLRAWCLAITIFLHSFNTGLAATRVDSSGNAALKYWQAFATLPTFTDSQNKVLAEVLTTPLDDSARKIVSDADYSLQMLQFGAALPQCDWGVSHEMGINTRLPQANAARVLANLACLRARSRFETGQAAEALDDILAGMTMSRHISLTGTNIMLLTGYAVEHRMIEGLALGIPKLDARMISDLKKRVAALPQGMSLAEATVSEEKFFLDWFIGIVKKAKDTEGLVAALAFIDIEPEGKPRASHDKSRAFVAECGGSVENVLRRIEETRESYANVAKMFALPVDQFEKEFDREAKKRAGNAVFNVFFPAMVNVRKAHERMEVRRALLSAALAVRQEGPEALKQHPDRLGGQPFEYAPFDGGFELRSKVKGRDDKPVTLTVGSHG
jgi:hypothetical protein